MNSTQSNIGRHEESQVVQCVTISYHVVAELMKHTEALGTDDAIAVTNGLLTRLRDAWTGYPEFLQAIDGLGTLPSSKDGKGRKPYALADRVEVLLAVLCAVCQAFLLDYDRPDQEGFGFGATRGGNS